MTISVTLQYFTWQMEATSYVYFIGWKFDMWIQAWKLIHSLQVMYEDWAVSFYREKQSLLTVELKNDHKAKEKVPAVIMRLYCQMFFEWLWNCVQETIEPGTSCFDKIPRNEAKICQETEFHSSEGHLFNFSWLLPDLIFFTGCCTGYICLLKCLPRFGRERPSY